MPLLHRPPAPDPIASLDPADWRPQPFGQGGFREVRDPIVEPLWSGVRVLARLERGASGEVAVAFSDEGADCTAEFEAVARALGAALLADDAVLDGYLTVEPTQESVGLMLDGPRAPSSAEMMSQLIVGRRADRQAEKKPGPDPGRPIAFMAVDILRLDGMTLLDLPLLERKRLLEAALEPGDLVRVTPYVRTPVGQQARTWYAQGFREMAYKPVNGRYRADGKPGDWAAVPIRSS